MAEPDITPSPTESIVSAAMAGSANASVPSDWTPPWQPPFLESFTSGIPTEKTVQQFEKDLSGRLETKLGAEGLIEKQQNADYADNQARLKQKYNQVAASTEDLKPWNPQTMAPPSTSLWEKLGSPGFIFAMLGSSFSAMPMNAAMNSGAAAINAINQGDMDGYNRAFDEWKANSNLAIQRHSMEQSEFEDIMKIGDRDVTHRKNQLEMLALKYGDQSALALYQNGMDKEAMEVREARNKALKQYTDVIGPMMEQHALTTGTDEKFHAGMPYDKAFNATVAEQEEAKRAGIHGADSQLWNAAGQLFPGDPQKQGDWVAEEKAKAHPVTAGQVKVSDEETIKAQIRKDDPSLPESEVIIKAKQKIAQAEKNQQAATKEQMDAMGWTDQSIDAAARTFNKTGRLPTYLGRGTIGPTVMGQIQARAADLLSQENKTPEDRAVNWQKYSAQRTGMARFLSGPQGNTVKSLNTVVFHLKTIEELSAALNNGNYPLFNRIAQDWAAETGKPEPTNFDTAKQIVGAEIIKAIGVAGAGTEDERTSAADNFNRARGHPAIMGATETVRKLLVGQLKSLRQQFTPATGLPVSDFDEMLDPQTRAYFGEEKSESKGKKSDDWGEMTVKHGG